MKFFGRSIIAVVFFVCACAQYAMANESVLAQNQQAETSSETLSNAEREFDVGNFRGAENFEVEVSKRTEKLSSEEKQRLFLLQARLAFAFQRGDSAIDDAFNRLVLVNPQATLDPIKDPPLLFSRWQAAVERANEAAKAASPISPKPQLLQNPTVAKIDNTVRNGMDFWLGLVPFGVGHFIHNENGKGATYLALETALLITTSGLSEGPWEDGVSSSLDTSWHAPTARERRIEAQSTAYSLAGLTGFAGMWGYEILDRVSLLARSDREGAAWARFALSFAPFGAAQYKNGDSTKAIGIASTQTTLLFLSGFLGTSSQRDWARFLFMGSLVFGAFDGWRGHNWEADPATQPRLRFTMFPFISESTQSTGLQFHVQLPL